MNNFKKSELLTLLMHDTDFDDCLDSDDDALFVEASNSLIEYDLTEITEIQDRNILQYKAASASVIPESFQTKGENVLSKEKTDTSCHFKLQEVSALQASSALRDSGKHLSISRENTDENINNIVTSTKSNTSSIFILNKKSLTPEISYINNRFTPGFTPKTKKRKLPGPAGLLELFDESEETEPNNSNKMLAMDVGFENVVSSQFTPEHLSLTSWRNLQTAVSSSSNLHAIAKYYSIKRVLQESSKKKLPKHMIVPVICVLLKKIVFKESATISVFMDDTGEINGKIDHEVISAYKEYMVEGTAFILKKVTFLCNILLLKTENLVSMYCIDDTEKHPQTLETILETSEPHKPMKCECSKLSHHNMKNNIHDISNHSYPSSHKSSCFPHNPNSLKNISNQTKAKSVSNMSLKQNCSLTINTPTDIKNMRSDAFLENLLDEDNCMDEFDELLGNLDEKSFIGDL